MGSAALLGTDSEERWLGCMPLFHVGGLSILLRACLAGSAVVVQPGFDAQAVSEALDGLEITGVSLVATMLGRLLDFRGERPAPPGLRRVLLGGGPAPRLLLARAHAAGYPLAPTYGLTEAASQVATRLPGDLGEPFDARLCPLPGTEIRVVDASGAVVGSGKAGEICVRGATLMRGYLGRPEATARALHQGWLHTGDLGLLDDRGRLRVLDRRDDLIVRGGGLRPGRPNSIGRGAALEYPRRSAFPGPHVGDESRRRGHPAIASCWGRGSGRGRRVGAGDRLGGLRRRQHRDPGTGRLRAMRLPGTQSLEAKS